MAPGPEKQRSVDIVRVGADGRLGRNLIPSKEFFFFGTDSIEPKALSAYLRGEKNTETAHHNISWASHTGRGLLFVGDKQAPSSVINLVSNEVMGQARM